MKKLKFDIFISYASKHKKEIEKISYYLNNNLKVWFDYWEVIPGEDIKSTTYSAIDNSTLALIFYDDEYLNDKFKKEEFLYLIKQKKEYFIFSEKEDFNNLLNFSIQKQVIKFDYKKEDEDKLIFKLRTKHPLFENIYLLENAKKYYKNSSYKESLNFYKKALKLSNTNEEFARCYNNIALNYQEINHYEESLNYYKKALKEYEKLNNQKNIAIVNNNMATLYEVLDEYDKAYSYYNHCIKINTSINNLSSIAKNYNNMASLFQKKDIEKAFEYLYMSLHINKKLYDNDYSVMINYNNIATSYQILDSSKLSLLYYNKVLEIDKKKLSKKNIFAGKIYRNLVLFFYENKNYYKSYDYLIKLIETQKDKAIKSLNTEELLKEIKFNINNIPNKLENLEIKYIFYNKRKSYKFNQEVNFSLVNFDKEDEIKIKWLDNESLDKNNGKESEEVISKDKIIELLRLFINKLSVSK